VPKKRPAHEPIPAWALNIRPSAGDPPLVPAKGDLRAAALKSLGLPAKASDERAHAVIHRWIETNDPRFERYYDRFVGTFEPTIRERVSVDPARLEWTLRKLLLRCDEPRRLLIEEALSQGFNAQIDLLMNDPAFEGAVEIDEIADRRVRYRWTFEQLAERIAARFPRQITAKHLPALAAVLARVWHVDWSDDPIEIVAGITGKAPAYAAVRHELRNLRRLSPAKGPGRPHEEPISAAEIAGLHAEAAQLQARMRETFALRDRMAEQDDVRKTIAASAGISAESIGLQRSVEQFYKRPRHEPRDVLIFMLSHIHRPFRTETAIRRIRNLFPLKGFTRRNC
jgi:hypothetical protein